MTILRGVSEEFLDWLNECPVQWFLINQTEDDVTYCFNKEVDKDG